MRKFDDFLEEQLQDEEFRKEYDEIQPEMDVIKAIVEARISQNLTQKELAQRTYASYKIVTNMSENPAILYFQRVAKELELVLPISFLFRDRRLEMYKEIGSNLK